MTTTDMGKYDLLSMMIDGGPNPEQLAKLAEILETDAATVATWFDQIGEQVLTIDEAAKLLAVGHRTVYNLLRSGELEGKKVGKSWRTTTAWVRAYLHTPDDPDDD